MSKYDELAGRLEQRLTTTPTRGHAVGRTSTPPPHDDAAAPTPPREDGSSRPGRTNEATGDDRDVPTRRRGHLVPADLHAAARRRKTLETDGGRATWTTVMITGVAELVERTDLVDLVAALPARTGPTRLVQATLPADLDRRLAACHLDLQDELDDSVTYEQLWELAIRLWVER